MLNIDSLNFCDAVTAASFAVQKLVDHSTEANNSIYHRHIWSVAHPLSNMPDCITRKMLPANTVIYYPRLFHFPDFTNADDWYDPQAQFW